MKRGFTLVELMVAITISILLVGGATVAVNQFLAKEKINQAAIEMVSWLNLARNLAITGQAPSGFVLDYVAVTTTTGGKVEAFPVNANSGIGVSYFSKIVSTGSVLTTQIAFGGLQFAVGTGKLLAKNAAPAFTTYPLPSNQGVGLSITSGEVSSSRQIFISPFGAAVLLPSP